MEHEIEEYLIETDEGTPCLSHRPGWILELHQLQPEDPPTRQDGVSQQ